MNLRGLARQAPQAALCDFYSAEVNRLGCAAPSRPCKHGNGATCRESYGSDLQKQTCAMMTSLLRDSNVNPAGDASRPVASRTRVRTVASRCRLGTRRTSRRALAIARISTRVADSRRNASKAPLGALRDRGTANARPME
ncbi:hypothetical protein MRX96_009938 [Rhipicephalus microplus]